MVLAEAVEAVFPFLNQPLNGVPPLGDIEVKERNLPLWVSGLLPTDPTVFASGSVTPTVGPQGRGQSPPLYLQATLALQLLFPGRALPYSRPG